MKKLKLLFVMLVIILMAVFACSSVNAAETKNLKITHERPLDVVGQKYTVLTSSSGSQLENPIFKIIEADGTYDDILYCLRSGLGFGNITGGGHSQLTYTETYNLKSDATNVMNYYRSTIGYSIRDAEYNAILWLADNMYLPGQDSIEMRNNLLRKAGIANSELTDNDIDFVQQMALWYFSNYDENGADNSLSLDIASTDLSTRIVEYTSNEYEIQRNQIDTLYTYLITEAQAHANDYGVGSTRSYIVDKPQVNVDSSSKTVTTVGNWTVIGPFSISETAGNIAYDFEIQVKDNSGVVIPEKDGTTPIIYVVTNPDNMVQDFASIKEAVGQGQFYLKISNRLASALDLTDAEIKAICTYDDTYLNYKTTVTLWLADVADQQPVIKINREEIKNFDLALRKYITKVNGTNILNTKNPTINTASLKNGTETTADYKHRKDPVVVKRNDKVTYRITAYNEGDIDGVVTSIIDYIPEGLEFYAIDNPELIAYKDNYTEAELVGKTFAFEYNIITRSIRIIPINGEYLFKLDGYDGITLDNESIDITCRVEVPNKTTDQVLTNIATMRYAPADIGNTDIKDRDSSPFGDSDDNFTLPRDWPGYGGNPSNKTDLTDSDYHYKGQEDDDDFDKVIVKGVTFDLALRKYITRVNGENIQTAKNPDIDTAELDNKTSTTAEYKHRKDPVTVKPGDLVTYRISIYNEGDIDGKVKEIVDCLPAGLEFDPASNPRLIEYKSSYLDEELEGKDFAYIYDTDNRLVRILPIPGLQTQSTSFIGTAGDECVFILNGYDGTTLDEAIIEIVCKVTATNSETDQILTNIASMIYETADGSNIPDRDSNGENFTRPSDDELPDYKGNEDNKDDLTDSDYHYKGQEDDDDFDKVILEGVTFDLALRKYITKVNGVDIPTTKNPNIDTTELDDKTATTAEYKHRKNPVTVKPGDLVTYKFSVYNEGDIDGIVTEIHDYLPVGLEFDPADNPKLIEYKSRYTEEELANYDFAYMYDSNNRAIVILPIIDQTYQMTSVTNNADSHGGNYLFLLNGYDGTTLDEASLEIVCRVTATNNEVDQILTNIATMEYSPADGSNIPDRDSSEHNLNRPSDSELPEYKGNEDNKDDLTDRDYHYEGQEDDDDFDKIIIKGVQFDLALRKNITKINDVEITNTKEPNVDTDKLDNDGGTTADYKHRKNPVTVKSGDKVTYRISVYNEGEISGRVKEIVDYLPEGLEFNPEDNPELIEYKDSYTEEELNGKAYIYEYDATNREIIILPIPSLEKGGRESSTEPYLFDLAGYDGTTLDTKSIEISFRVTANNKEEDQTLTNIATMKYGPSDGSDIPDRDSSEDEFNRPSDNDLSDYKGNEDNKDDLTDSDYHYKGQEDDDDFDKIIIKGVQFDLALRKNITKVNGIDITRSKEPDIDTAKLEDETETTAEYKHRKDAVEVRSGNKVSYKISVYNEGEIDGIVTEIVDYLPEGLEFNPEDNPELIEYKYNYTDEELEGKKFAYVYDSSTRTIRILPIINHPINLQSTSSNDNMQEQGYIFLLKGFDGVTLDSDSLEIICRISASVGSKDKILTNIATMKYKPANPEDVELEDRDSSEDEFNRPEDSELPDYKGNEDNKDDLTDSDYHYKGQEDDDDFDKIIIPGVPFDLSLRKFVTKVNGKNITSRIPEVDTSKLNTINGETGKRVTTATYTHSKEPVIVKKGDIVTFTFRVYNEGQIDGYAEEIADYLPEGLGYIMDYKTNTDNFWVPVVDSTTKVLNLVGTDGIYTSESTIKNLTLSDFNTNRIASLSDVKIVAGKAKISSSAIEYEKIKAYNPDLTSTDIDESDDWQQSANGTDGLYYRDVEVACIVLAENTFKGQLRNIAEIQEDNPVDDNDNPIDIEDRDSTPDDVDTDDYTPPTDNSEYQEDDDDYEPLELRYFDLALRKFITAVNDDAITTRIPDPTVKSDGEIEYIHDKTPIYVANSDIVTYTIRVYNEGTVLGYATEVSDDIPDGLEFLPNNDTNKEYKWIMIDKDGNETDNPEEAVEIRTKYLENSLLRPYDPTKEINVIDFPDMFAYDGTQELSEIVPLNPDYAEVKVAFKVVDKNITQPDRIIVNKAQITDDKPVDEDGNELDIPDEDSIPDEWNPGEDDQDIEKIYVKKFDLALLKWVTKTIVTVDGKTTTTATGFTPYDNPEPVAKVVVDKKQLDKTTVKFVYNIIIFNQGEIAGYATEITDYIPAGLEFFEEDNPIWTKEGEGKITTRALEEILLQPGESATIEVIFRWKRGANNLGLKTNIAEISEDYNDKGAPDIDSIPDNVITPDYEEQQEDDDDRALVILELKTGGFKASYLWVGFIFVTIIAGGIITIKKFVI